MHNLRHYYYQNKEKIWKVGLFIAFLLGIIYFINSKVVTKNNNLYLQDKKDIYSNEKDKIYIDTESAISGNTITESEVKKINNNISKFLNYCKNENKEEAYNMLSKDCKENEYDSIQKFEERYLKSKFNKQDIYEIECLRRDTYKISISQDILETGNMNYNRIIEYITIVDEGNEKKLNIGGYIGKEEINKYKETKEIKVTVLEKKVYMEYEEYKIKVENNSNKKIKLDSLKKLGTMYIETSMDNQYYALAHELYSEDLEVRSKHETNINIKYAKSYLNEETTERVVFKDVILDYPKYKMTQNKTNFQEIEDITINL